MAETTPDTLIAGPSPAPLRGSLRPPGDKSISHRALILAMLADGETVIDGLLHSADVDASMRACGQLGAGMSRVDGVVKVGGRGLHGLAPPDAPLDLGNSGTAMRLLAGVLAGQAFGSVLCGDASLSRRPMDRIVVPLREMGAVIRVGPGSTAPLEIEGGHHLRGIDYRTPVASAQVKSCLLLAGLYASGETRVREPLPSRDHTERMLRAFGVTMIGPAGVKGGSELTATRVRVPGDLSSAAFLLAAGALVAESRIELKDVGLNPTRSGILRLFQEMGCDVRVAGERRWGEEPVGALEVRWRPGLRGADLGSQGIPSLIDELPIIMAMAALAEGTTRIRGAAELRVKESDRISVMAGGLSALGFCVREYADGLDIAGSPARNGAGVEGGAVELDAAGDHRCAMSFCILAQALGRTVKIKGASQIDTSYPGFVSDLAALGGCIRYPLQDGEA